VAVVLAHGRGERVAVVDIRLFLPVAWTQDAKRCEKAKVPEGERQHRTQTEPGNGARAAAYRARC
jgi:hypothetical protein